jgi:polysaccharide deacetylase 2 family uncharacterized protein YibQ
VSDELSAPLGRTPKKPKRLVLPKAVPTVVAGALAATLAGFLAWTIFVDDPLGGEPVAIVPTAPRAAPKTKPGTDAATISAQTSPTLPPAGAAAVNVKPAGTPPTQTVTIIDGMSGKREQVTVTPDAGKAAPEAGRANPSDPGKAAGIDPRLVETSPHGRLPKIAADGTRASDFYASPQAKAAARKGPQIAIVVGRLGISPSGTTEALAKLPGAVTLGFTPYGADLDRWVARARGEGREVLLQVPMEPFDYPDNDPGPQTLLTTLLPEQNTERLHWSMSRFQGYIGIGNYMGARFSTNEPGVASVLREAGSRGLIYFDDGAASRSLAGQIAAANNVPFAKADVVLDVNAGPGEIDAALVRLEAMARERGTAVGSASASAVSIDRIAKWAKAAATRGVTLVPLSVVANKPKSS